MNSPRYITTSTGVRIGAAYQRPLPKLDRDHQTVQAALLEPRTTQAPTLLARVVSPLYRWL